MHLGMVAEANVTRRSGNHAARLEERVELGDYNLHVGRLKVVHGLFVLYSVVVHRQVAPSLVENPA
uniref:Uncharacterized protein n=1 Tax=Coccidioides posadasii RMSCC 3488 TaxID=454284 RepID=A0A0J6ID95_COCPO|nr:hypothetical protein CPAG_05996 [Coccidioides posadasii RMSCC 3488]